MTKLSVIIPVYNTEKYLEACLQSIFSQSFKDIEVICVDDGSIDNSLKILNKYENIKIFKTENKGSGVARNLGLQNASGDYVLFVDSDDKILNGAFEKLVSAMENNDTDVLIFGGLTCVNEKLRTGSYSVNRIPRKYLNKTFNKNDFKSDIFKFPSTAWTKLYKRKFLIDNDIKFQEIMVGQDQIFFIKTMLLACSIFVLPENLYCYTKKRPGSVTSAKKKTNFSPIDVFWAVNEALEYPDYEILNRYFLKATFWLPKMQEDLKPCYYKRYLEILEYVKREYPKAWWAYFHVNKDSSYISLKIKHAACLMIKLVIR